MAASRIGFLPDSIFSLTANQTPLPDASPAPLHSLFPNLWTSSIAALADEPEPGFASDPAEQERRKTSASLFERQVHFLNRLGSSIHNPGGRPASRAGMIRLLVDVLSDSELDLRGIASEADLRGRILDNLRRDWTAVARITDSIFTLTGLRVADEGGRPRLPPERMVDLWSASAEAGEPPPAVERGRRKVTVRLFARQVQFLENLAGDIRYRTGATLCRSELLRATIDAVIEGRLELDDLGSEAALRDALLGRLRAECRFHSSAA